MRLLSWFYVLACSFNLNTNQAQDISAAKESLRKGTSFFYKTISVNGGYVYFVSEDHSRRLGEGAANPTEIWVQPPGTPTVGFAYLKAWKATRDERYLEAATSAGEALVYGQLQSGGWRNSIDFNPRGKRVDQYRNGKGKGKNYSTLDDGITQSALRFLIQLDEAHKGNHKSIRDAVNFGLANLLRAQFPNGAFPQVWKSPVDQTLPTKTASYPEYDWKTEGRIKEYWNLYTLNDGLSSDVIDTLAEAYRVYHDVKFLSAIKRHGNFLIAAQMPKPQRGWAQQYNYEMQPVWARKFEPPAIAGSESQDVMFALLKIYSITLDKKFLPPVIEGVKFLESSLLKDGQLARYYELETNRPLYMIRKGDTYSLTYSDASLPSHYGWKSRSKLEEIKSLYRYVISNQALPKPQPLKSNLQNRVIAIIKDQDKEGRWLSAAKPGERLIGQAKFKPGEKYISSQVFARNVEILSSYIIGSQTAF